MKRFLSSLAVALALCSSAFAADTSVPNMTAGGAMSDTDLIYCAQSAGTTDRKCTGAQAKTYVNTSAVRATTTTGEALANSDQNKLVTFSNAGAIACTIAQAGSGGNFVAGWAVSLRNLGAGTVTCTPTTSTVDGAANFTLTTGQGLDLYSDGTNYFTQGGKGATTDAGALTSGTLAAARMPALTGDCVTAVNTVATNCDFPNPGLTAGQWYVPANMQAVATGQAALANTFACSWAVIPQKNTISQLGARISTAGTTNFQMALYTNVNGRPGVPLSNTGSIVTTATGAVSAALGANKQVGPGGSNAGKNVWLCMNVGDGTTVFQVIATTSLVGATAFGDASLGNVLMGAANAATHVYCGGAACNGGSSTFGIAWPTLTGSTWTLGGASTSGFVMPIIAYNPVSVP